jgi:hypothetical protein
MGGVLIPPVKATLFVNETEITFQYYEDVGTLRTVLHDKVNYSNVMTN